MKSDTFTDGIQFFKTLTISKIWNGFLLRSSYYLSLLTGKINHWGNPEFLSIEPVNLCNLMCPECPTGKNQLKRTKTYFSLTPYNQLIQQCKKHLSFLQLYFQGEPFLHPKLFDFIKLAVNANIYTATSTNGHFLTVENCHHLIDSGLHRIIISIDGTSQETYETYRVGGNLQKVIQGIENLNAIKKERKSKKPYTILQFVVFKSNEHQIEEIKLLAKKWKVGKLVLKSAQIENYIQGNAQMTTLEKYNRYKKNKEGAFQLKRKPDFKCERIWKGAVVSASQQVLPCCFDKNGEFAYGNLTTKTLSDLFTEKQTDKLRQQVWGFPVKRPSICSNCSEGLRKTWFE